jgi:hypothetical protein
MSCLVINKKKEHLEELVRSLKVFNMSWMCELLFVEVDNETLFASARSNGLNPEGAVCDGKITIFGLSSKKVWKINSKLYLCIYGINDVRTISPNSTSE